MARGPLVTPEVKALITSLHRSNPTWKPREIRMVVRSMLRAEAIEHPEKHPELLLKLNRGWPSEASVRQKIKDKPNATNPNLIDKPWSISTLANPDYFIPPEAIPTVIAFYKKRLGENDVLTIREALWAARLFKIVEPLDLVFDWAFLYAIDEIIVEEHGDTSKSNRNDLEILYEPQIACETMREIDIWQIAYKHKADPMQLKELNLSIEETEEVAKSGKYYWAGWGKTEAQSERMHKEKKQK